MIVSIFAIAASVYAAQQPIYDVTFSTSASGREITASHLTLKSGVPAKVSQADANGTVEVEIGAKPQKNGAVFIAASITEIDRSGRRRQLGKPQIVALQNEPASIEVGDKDPRTGKDVVHYQMRVLAKIKN